VSQQIFKRTVFEKTTYHILKRYFSQGGRNVKVFSEKLSWPSTIKKVITRRKKKAYQKVIMILNHFKSL